MCEPTGSSWCCRTASEGDRSCTGVNHSERGDNKRHELSVRLSLKLLVVLNVRKVIKKRNLDEFCFSFCFTSRLHRPGKRLCV